MGTRLISDRIARGDYFNVFTVFTEETVREDGKEGKRAVHLANFPVGLLERKEGLV